MKSLLLDIDKFLRNEKFSPEAMSDIENWGYFSKLSELKKEFKDFFTQPTISFEYANIDGVYKRINQYILQIQRLRLVIDPHFKLVIQTHTENRLYIVVRADWVDDDGTRKRMVAKVIGRLEPGKTKNSVSMEEAREVIMPVLREKYKKCEEKFGILV
jgi:hypothetical protein